MIRFLPILWLLACVPKARYELAQVQLDATRTALSARTAACNEAQTAHEAEVRSLDDERQHLGEKVADLAAQVDALQGSLAAALEAGGDAQAAQVAQAVAALEAAQDRARRRAAEIDEIQAALAPFAADGRAVVKVAPQAVRVVLPWDKLFQPGVPGLTPWGEAATADLGAAIAVLRDRRIRVEGHYVDPDYHSGEFPSAWELAFGRAVLVLRAMRDQGMDLPAFVASYGESAPGEPDGDHRVEVVISLRNLE